jgi:hypothetical protein
VIAPPLTRVALLSALLCGASSCQQASARPARAPVATTLAMAKAPGVEANADRDYEPVGQLQ